MKDPPFLLDASVLIIFVRAACLDVLDHQEKMIFLSHF